MADKPKIPQEEFNAAVQAHNEWLTNPTTGKRLVLVSKDLRGSLVQYKRYILNQASLIACDLSFNMLAHAVFARADLTLANLAYSDLWSVDFTGAKLSGAAINNSHCDYCNFSVADLSTTNCAGTSLNNVVFAGARLNWQDRTLLGSVLLNVAVTSAQEMLATYIIRKYWCWKYWMVFTHPEKDWAIKVLGRLAENDPLAPTILLREYRRLTRKQPSTANPPPVTAAEILETA